MVVLPEPATPIMIMIMAENLLPLSAHLPSHSLRFGDDVAGGARGVHRGF
jgi:hypothetical protein